MNGTDALRKNYTTLTPKERAAMAIIEATTHQREAVMQALTPNTAAESAMEGRVTFAIACITGWGLTHSLFAELHGASHAAIREGKPIDRIVKPVVDAYALSIAWAKALQQLEAETSMPFVAAASFFGDNQYLIGKLEEEFEIDCTEQLEVLRRMWEAVDVS
jgi:hypothetical protein